MNVWAPPSHQAPFWPNSSVDAAAFVAFIACGLSAVGIVAVVIVFGFVYRKRRC